jgi:hypothetical protein
MPIQFRRVVAGPSVLSTSEHSANVSGEARYVVSLSDQHNLNACT